MAPSVGIRTRLEMAMRNVETTIVVPARRCAGCDSGDVEKSESCELSALDELMPNIYVPLLLLFDAAPDARGLAGVVEELKQSLAKVLVPFYPLAGRMVQKPGHPPRLLCNNAGAVFTSAEVDAPMSQVYGGSGVGGDPEFRPVPMISGISWVGNAVVHKLATAGNAADHDLDLELEKPALVVQVTGFECGGVALAINWLHSLADGLAASQFLKAWSDACANNRSGGLGLDLLQPDHGRLQSLKKAHLLAQPGAFSDQELAGECSPPGLEHMQVWTREMVAAARNRASLPAIPSFTPIARLVHYTEAAIRQLKALAASNVNNVNGPGEYFSTVTCVSAHLWQCVTRARLHFIREAQAQAQAQGEKNGPGPATCILQSAVDAKVRRTGCSSSSSSSECAGPDSGSGSSTTLLPASYFGNSIVMVRTKEVAAEEVVRQPLGFAASLIKHSVAGINGRAYQYVLALSDKHGPCNITMMPPGVADHFITSSWYRFPLYHLHFCFPAQPVLAVSNLTPSPYLDGCVVLLPSPLGPNNLTAMVLANASVMANLLLDQDFLEYASLSSAQCSPAQRAHAST